MIDFGLLAARLFLGVPFMIWGWMKLRGGAAHMVPALKALGLPDAKFLAYMVGLCEFTGGLGITLGYPVTLFGILLGLWCLLTGYQEHRSDETSLLNHIAMAGGYFAIAAAGAGGLALFGGQPTGIFAYLH